MKKHFIQVFYWLALLLPLTLSGQDDVLSRYVDQALTNNLSLRTYTLADARQQNKIYQAKSLWNPSLDLSANYLVAQGGRVINFPIGDLFNPVYGTLNRLTASQSFPEDLENVETQLTPNNFVDASIAISKPLINSAIRYNVLIQQALLGLSDIDTEIRKNELKFQVKQAYYNFLKTLKGEEILDQNLDLLEETLKFNRKLIQYDKATPDVLSDIEYQIESVKSQKSAIQNQRSVTRIILNTLMNREINTPIEIDSSVLEEGIQMNSLEGDITEGIQNQPLYKKLDLEKEVNVLQVQRINAQKNPTLGVQGAIGIQTEDFTFDEGGPLFTLGLSLGWNLMDGGLRQRKIDELQIASEEIKLNRELITQQVTVETTQAHYQLRTLQANLSSDLQSVRAATTSYDAILMRYKSEKALFIELLTAQNRLIASRLNQVVSGIDVLIAKANLERIKYKNDF